MLLQKEVTEEDVAEEKRVRQIFKETSGEDLEVDAYELREILDANFKKGELYSNTALVALYILHYEYFILYYSDLFWNYT